MIVIVDNVVPTPISVDPNETGLTTNFLIVSLYLKLKISVLFDFISNLNLSPTDNPCCCPVVVAVATVTVPLTFLNWPVMLFVINSNLTLSDPVVIPVIICLKNTLFVPIPEFTPFVLKPTLSVESPINSSLIFTQNNSLNELKSNWLDKSKFLDAIIVDPRETRDNWSLVLNLWFGKNIAFGGIDFLIGVTPTNPTVTFVKLVPIPTDFSASKYWTFGNSIFLFSNFLLILYVNSFSDLVTTAPETWSVGVVELCPLITLCLLFTSSWSIIKSCSVPITTVSLTLNFLLRVGSEKVINVVIPALTVAIEVDIEEATVDTPIILTPSIFLYFVDDIPVISTTSPSSNPWGIVDKPVTFSSDTENFKLLTTVFVVPTETIVLPKTSSTLADIVGSVNFIWSFTL